MYPNSFKKLIQHFASLPSVGPKMAERLVLYLFKQEKERLGDFAESLHALQSLHPCRRCYNIAENGLCEICKNTKRNQKEICTVEEPLDIISIEKTGTYHGLYHVLGGVISPSVKNQELRLAPLLERIADEKTQEIILATNPTTEGDATALYVRKKIRDSGLEVKITRLARGLATGGDIEYADEMTLSAALTNRKELV